MTWPTLFDTRLEEYDAMELPGQQLSATFAPTPLDHLLNLNIKGAPGCQRLTGIMASMGRSTYDIDVLQGMMEAGMNIAFLNMSFGSRDEHIETIKMLRQAATNFGAAMGKVYPLSIAIRLAGRKIRTGRINETFLEDFVELKTGDTVKLTTDETYKDRCSVYTVYVDFMNLSEQVNKGNTVLLDNENIELKIEVISATTLTCKIIRGGLLGSYKDVFIPNVVLNMPNYSDKDKQDIEMAIEHQVDIIIASFVNCANNVMELKSLLGSKGKKISIIANIQTVEGYSNFDSILEIADCIQITRQELGSDITPKKLVIAQKNMIARANLANVPICVSGHHLSSMLHKKLPLRAELLDIANCILDGADCLVLGPETAIGAYPVETVKCLASACKEAEMCLWSRQILLNLIDKTHLPCDQTTCAAVAGALVAQRCIAAAIIVITTSGKSAQIVAKYRPRCPILAVTRYPPVARRLHMWKGIVPIIYEDPPDGNWENDVNNRVGFCVKWAMEKGFIRVGDPIVIICGWRQGSGFTNTMKVIYASGL